MKFSRILIEEQVRAHPVTVKILERLTPNGDQDALTVIPIRKIEDVFGRVYKPYLQKRDHLQLFIGRKEGELLKEAPDAYGISGEPHYYFVHAYNCIYECQYCYLQGYFSSPDLVLFVNHDEILDAIEEKVRQTPDQRIWFHSGELSDSLALNHLTDELPFYWESFSRMPQAMLELRTKSVQTQAIEKLPPLPNVIISFSLSPKEDVQELDLKTPSLKLRLEAIQRLVRLGHPIGIHLDPMVESPDFEEKYQKLIQDIKSALEGKQPEYISIGVVRFSKESFRSMKRNYPESSLLGQDFKTGFDGKIRLPANLSDFLLGEVETRLVESGFEAHRIYRCMEPGMEPSTEASSRPSVGQGGYQPQGSSPSV